MVDLASLVPPSWVTSPIQYPPQYSAEDYLRETNLPWVRNLYHFLDYYSKQVKVIPEDIPIYLRPTLDTLTRELQTNFELSIRTANYTLYPNMDVDKTLANVSPLAAIIKHMKMKAQIKAVESLLPNDQGATKQLLMQTGGRSILDVFKLPSNIINEFLITSTTNRLQAVVDIINNLAGARKIRIDDRETLLNQVGTGLFTELQLEDMRRVLRQSRSSLYEALAGVFNNTPPTVTTPLTATVIAALKVGVRLSFNLKISTDTLHALGEVGQQLNYILQNIS